MTTSIAISGALGRMGKTLLEAVSNHPDTHVGAAIEYAEHPLIKHSISSLASLEMDDIILQSDLMQCIKDFDVLVEFSTIDSTLKHLEVCVAQNKRMVIGTTGFSADQKKKIIEASKDIPVLFAPNMSIGVNLVLDLLNRSGRSLMGKDYDVEIIETHHRNKVDAPSGTALKMGEVLAQAMDIQDGDQAIYSRHGQTGERPKNKIAYQTLRAGDVVGEHTVIFATEGERIEITHKASSRMTFAKGAVQAAFWLSNQPAGLYTMQDVLNLN